MKACGSDRGGEGCYEPPEPRGAAKRARLQVPFGLECQPCGAMESEGCQSDSSDEDCVPIENSCLAGGEKVCPQRLEEMAGDVERNSTNHIAKCGAIKNGEQKAGKRKSGVPNRGPDWAAYMTSEFEGNSAENQQPENHHQRQIEAAEACGIKRGEREVERATRGNQPHFVATPHGANRTDQHAALCVAACDPEMQDAGADVEAVEHDVACEHESHQAEPDASHRVPSSVR